MITIALYWRLFSALNKRFLNVWCFLLLFLVTQYFLSRLQKSSYLLPSLSKMMSWGEWVTPKSYKLLCNPWVFFQKGEYFLSYLDNRISVVLNIILLTTTETDWGWTSHRGWQSAREASGQLKQTDDWLQKCIED